MLSIRRVLIAIFTVGVSGALAGEPEAKHPFFVGVRRCASCHRGDTMGRPLCQWLNSKHARAYAVLAQPEALEIAKLSGIPQEPQESVLCLGCHATGAHAEDWEKEPTFHVEDGVQCEKCHGAGSEYMAADVMADPQAAMDRGLIMPTPQDCLNCHRVKGSHVAVHHLPALDIDSGLRQIAHPVPEKWSYGAAPARPTPAGQGPNDSQYLGSHACGACHKGPRFGYQFSKWRLSAHARAYGVLGSERGGQIAREQGVSDPTTSPLCLRCHTTAWIDPAGGQAETFTEYEGVGCEACHGAGSRYALEAIMLDDRAAQAAGLKPVKRQTCLACHDNPHGKGFDYEQALAKIAHRTQPPQKDAQVQYKTPLNLALAPGGGEIYVACEASHSVIVVDTASRRKVAEIPVGGYPHDVTFRPDGAFAYASNRLDDSVSVIETAGRRVVAVIGVGDEPHGLLTDPAGKHLYVLNTSSDDISVIDTETRREIKRLRAGRNPWSLALSGDGRKMLITNNLSHFVPFRQPPESEITVIDVERAVVEARLTATATNLLQGIDWHPAGEMAIFTHNRTKNLVPMTRLLQGWTITNGIGIVWRDGTIDQVLLDEPHRCFPDAADVAFTPDGRFALVTSSGSNRVAVVDVAKLTDLLQHASAYERRHVVPNHLGKAAAFVVDDIATGESPRGIVVTADGRSAFVVNALDDSLTVIDLARRQAVERIDLGGPETIDKVRWGEKLFHSAEVTFHRQFSCHSCHPDGHVDGLTYDIEPDGIGVDPVDNRTLRGILDTAPFKWSGLNPSLKRQCGPRLAVFFTRIKPFTPEQLDALDTYISTIPRPPNRYRPLGADLLPAQSRGKMLFERSRTNDGRLIRREDRCSTCHFAPLFTDRQVHDVGTKMPMDIKGKFDTPHLNNIYDSAPYLHNGIAETLEEIWTKYNPDDRHGVTNDMTKDQLNDLIEYLKTL
ncbi:MAG: beta-propeller fold lactonase family protein [Sedimentisphaerales bacterium]|nr:beta-propeller fold lactonase family protein [Sedimentisphaerales bacterium]